MPSRRRELLSFTTLLLSVVLGSGCVTQTERIPPYERIPKDESVWEELRREFGWQKPGSIYKETEPAEPFYKRAMHGITTTVSEWFTEDNERLSEEEIAANRQRFNRKRAQALERLKQQQELDQRVE